MGTLFISNRNNVKGLEFPFVICIMQNALTYNYSILITADVFTSDICTEINDLYQSGKKIPEIMKLTGLSRASVHP